MSQQQNKILRNKQQMTLKCQDCQTVKEMGFYSICKLKSHPATVSWVSWGEIMMSLLKHYQQPEHHRLSWLPKPQFAWGNVKKPRSHDLIKGEGF